MRALRLLGWTAGGVVAVALFLLAGLQTAPGQRALMGVVSSLVSTPDFRADLRDPSGTFPTDLTLGRIEVADRNGTWLTLDRVRLHWSLASLLRGEVVVHGISAERVDLLRPPLPSAATGDGGSPLGLPEMQIDIRAIAIADLRVGAAIAAVDSRWRGSAQGVLAKRRVDSRLSLLFERTDADGRASAAIRFDQDASEWLSEVVIEERSDRAVSAALLGRPGLDTVSLALKVRGDIASGKGELKVSAGDALSATGEGDWQRVDALTRARLNLVASAPGIQLLRSPLSLTATATFDAANVIVEKAVLEAGTGRLEAAGRYRIADDALDTRVTIASEKAGALAPYVAGTGWHDLRAVLDASITHLSSKAAGSILVRLSAREVTLEGAPLPPLRDVDVKAQLGLEPDLRLALKHLDLGSSFVTGQATGSYAALERSGKAKGSFVVSDLSPLSDWIGRPVTGRAALELEVGTIERGITASWQGRLLELGAGGVATGLVQPEVRLSGSGSRQHDGAWELRDAKVAMETATLTVDGRGQGIAGDLKVALVLPDLARLGLPPGGSATLTTQVAMQADGSAKLHMDVEGQVAGRPLALAADMLRDANGLASMPTMQGRWASADLEVGDFSVRPGATAGRARLRVGNLADVGLLARTAMGGKLEVDMAMEAGDKIEGKLTATGLRGVGDLSTVLASVDGTLDKAAVAVQARGLRNSANLRAILEPDARGLKVALNQFDGRQDNLPITLTAPVRGHLAGSRFVIDQPGRFSVAGGTVTLGGIVDPEASDLTVDLAALPMSALKAVDPAFDFDGTLQGKARVRGALAAPRIEATYAATGLRSRRPGASFLPPMALNGTASLGGQQAAFDARLAALTVKGTATLPQGRQPMTLKARLGGAIDLGLLAPFTGTRVRSLAGRLQPDLEIRVVGDKVSGNGRLALTGASLSLPDAGLRLERGEATMVMNDDTVQIERLKMATGGGGDITVNGTARLDPTKGVIVALQVMLQKAQLANRADLVSAVSGTLKLTGSTGDGFDVAGPLTIDRAEINIGQTQSADYPIVEVREINKPGVPNAPPPESRKEKAPPKPAAGPAVRMAITIDAPRAVFVRGRGLDAEVGGRLAVGGIASQPSVTGSLELRRGEFNLAGRRLSFARGRVSLVRLDSIEPLLDFAATTNAGDTTVNMLITGTSREPKIALSSTPSMPQDELMAMLLFGRTTGALSPFEVAQVAQALAELSGLSRGPGLVGGLRKALGFDRLSVSSSGQGLESTTLEGGRYVAPGVYIGAKQGASAGSSRGVVEIEVLRRTKIEADIGADSKGRVGVKFEWDY